MTARDWEETFSFQGRLALPDPKRSISFLHSRRSAKRNICPMEISEPAVGDLTQPATADLGVRSR